MNERRDLFVVFTEVAAAAATNIVTYTCPNGYTVKVLYFAGYHNEGGALNAQFVLNMSGLARDLHPVVSLASATLMQFYGQVHMPEPLILHQGDTLSFTAPVTGAHVNTYRLVAEIRKGEGA